MELIKQVNYDRPEPSGQFKVFVSYYSLDEVVYRIIENCNYYQSYTLINNKPVIIDDCRLFLHNGKRCIHTSVFEGSIANMVHYIIDYETGEKIIYIVNEPNFSYGKNWASIVNNNKLFFIHSFDPFTVIHDGQVVLKIPTEIAKCESDNFCGYRGGTNGLVYNEYIYGIGHYTPCYDIHDPFLWVLNLKEATLELGIIEDYPNLYPISDPTTLWTENGETYASIFESSKGWFHLDCKCESRVYKINFEELYNKMKTAKSYKKVNIDNLAEIIC